MESNSNIGNKSQSFQSETSFEPPLEDIKTELHTMVDKLQLDEPPGRRPLWQRVLLWQIPIWTIAFLMVLSYNPHLDNCNGVKITYRTQTLCIANDNDFFLFVENLACDVIDKGSVMKDSLTMDSTAAQAMQGYFTQYNFSLETQLTEVKVLRGMRNAGHDSTSFCKNVAVAFWNAGVRLLGEGKTDSACLFFNKLELWKWRDSMFTTSELEQLNNVCPPIKPSIESPVTNPFTADNEYEPFQQNGKFGYRHNKTRQTIIIPQYENAYFFLEDLGAVKQNKKWGFIDKNNAFVISPQFDSLITRFHNGVARVIQERKEFCIDKSGKIVDCASRKQKPKTPIQNKSKIITKQQNTPKVNLKAPTVTPSVTFGPKIELKPIDTLNRQNTNRAQQLPVVQTTTNYINKVAFDMVTVKGGTFQMGDVFGEGSANEKPVHTVTLSDFSIGVTEVTQAQWKAVMGKDNNPSNFKGDNLPIETVSWDDIQAFLRKLNSLSKTQYRLPTEAEWEYAARGGNASRGFKYSGSNNIDEVAWYMDNANSKTYNVRTKKANELGIYDMSGNVWEWCSDWYDENYYKISPAQNPKGAQSGSYRVYRGGSWFRNAVLCRPSFRNINKPASRDDGLGFRMCYSLQ